MNEINWEDKTPLFEKEYDDDFLFDEDIEAYIEDAQDEILSIVNSGHVSRFLPQALKKTLLSWLTAANGLARELKCCINFSIDEENKKFVATVYYPNNYVTSIAGKALEHFKKLCSISNTMEFDCMEPNVFITSYLCCN